MATKTINIPDLNLARRINKAAYYLNYQDEVYDDDPESPTYDTMIPNPVSKVDTIMEKLKSLLTEMIKAGGRKMAEDAARAEIDVENEADIADITIT